MAGRRPDDTGFAARETGTALEALGVRGRSGAEDPEQRPSNGSVFSFTAWRVMGFLSFSVCCSGSSRCSSPATHGFYPDNLACFSASR
jgi:hypothetical protein